VDATATLTVAADEGYTYDTLIALAMQGATNRDVRQLTREPN
jgi:hypothetical protein